MRLTWAWVLIPIVSTGVGACLFPSLGGLGSDAGVDDVAFLDIATETAPVVCDAGLTPCTSCVDVTSDMHNCGACGHDCMFSGCSDSICQPLTLASGPVNPHGIAIDANNVYFTTYGDNTVMSVPKAGGTLMPIATGVQLPSIIAVSGTTLYWTNWTDGTVTSAAVTGGTVTTLVSGLNAPFGLTVDSTNVYFAENGNGVVGLVPLNAGPAVDAGIFTILTSGPSNLVNVGVNATQAFLTNASGSVGSVQLMGDGGIEQLSMGQSPWGLAIDATNVYFGDQNAGAVGRMPLGGGAVTLLATSQDTPRGVAVDASFVYWAERGGGHIRKVPISGGAATTLAFNQGGPINLALDDTTIYWTNFDDNTVRKVAK
jgi:Low-density lipoprotein receptor repeat class B